MAGGVAHWKGPGAETPAEGPVPYVWDGCTCIRAAGVYCGGGDILHNQWLGLLGLNRDVGSLRDLVATRHSRAILLRHCGWQAVWENEGETKRF